MGLVSSPPHGTDVAMEGIVLDRMDKALRWQSTEAPGPTPWQVAPSHPLLPSAVGGPRPVLYADTGQLEGPRAVHQATGPGVGPPSTPEGRAGVQPREEKSKGRRQLPSAPRRPSLGAERGLIL